MTYGGTLPALTASFAGLVNGDSSAAIQGLTLSTVPATSHAGSYTITASGGTDPDYSITLVSGTLTIGKASPVVTWTSPMPIAMFTPLGGAQLDATANVAGVFAYTPAAGILLQAGTQTLSATFTPADKTDYTTASTSVSIVVLAPGSSIVVGSQLFLAGGLTTNDQVQVKPAGTSNTGSTGIQVTATLNRKTTTYTQTFTAISFFGGGGNDNVQLASTLTVAAIISEGNGNDNVQAGYGNNTVTLGNGNDNVQAGYGNNTVTLGNGNDNVQLGNGNNVVTLGNGNDNVQVGDGNNVIVAGSGNNNIQAGNGDNLIVGGPGGHDNIQAGNGNNILIDGSVSQTSAALEVVLQEWMNDIAAGKSAAAIASDLSQSLTIKYNTANANTLHAGTGFDWFWAAYSKDNLNNKPGDLLN